VGPTIAADEIAQLYGVAVNTVYRLHRIRSGFPPPAKVGRRCVWPRAEVMADHATLFEAARATPEHRLQEVRAETGRRTIAGRTLSAEPIPTNGKDRGGKRGPRW
jgi:predicted DNA-binding transcriptional regulator AlpA